MTVARDGRAERGDRLRRPAIVGTVTEAADANRRLRQQREQQRAVTDRLVARNGDRPGQRPRGGLDVQLHDGPSIARARSTARARWCGPTATIARTQLPCEISRASARLVETP